MNSVRVILTTAVIFCCEGSSKNGNNFSKSKYSFDTELLDWGFIKTWGLSINAGELWAFLEMRRSG